LSIVRSRASFSTISRFSRWSRKRPPFPPTPGAPSLETLPRLTIEDGPQIQGLRRFGQPRAEVLVERRGAVPVEADDRDVVVEIDVDAGKPVGLAVNPAEGVRAGAVQPVEAALQG
jgi:hypothetical protein